MSVVHNSCEHYRMATYLNRHLIYKLLHTISAARQTGSQADKTKHIMLIFRLAYRFLMTAKGRFAEHLSRYINQGGNRFRKFVNVTIVDCLFQRLRRHQDTMWKCLTPIKLGSMNEFTGL